MTYVSSRHTAPDLGDWANHWANSVARNREREKRVLQNTAPTPAVWHASTARAYNDTHLSFLSVRNGRLGTREHEGERIESQRTCGYSRSGTGDRALKLQAFLQRVPGSR